MTLPRRRRTPLLLPVATLALAAVLTGCGEPPPDSTASSATAGSDAEDLADAADDAGVPEECQEAFPLALEPADPADVPFPADWPETPVAATLCSTGATLDDSMQTADYATAATPAEVLDAYEAALAPSYDLTREDQGLGEVLAGSNGSVSFQLQPRDGAFALLLSAG